jgi:photosystem II stability/assembly factor-like uncharacterized protein
MDSGAPRPRVRRGRSVLAPVAVSLAVALAVAGHPEPIAAASKPKHLAPPPVVAIGQPASVSMNTATAVACADSLHCWAVGFGSGATAAIDATINGGKTWSPQTVPTAVGVLAAVSCFDKRHCMAVGSAAATGAVVATTDGGATWMMAQDPTGAAAVTGVDCTGRRRCVALGTDGMTYWTSVSSNDGATWTRAGNLPSGMTASAGLTCRSALLCLVAGYTPTGPGRAGGAIATTADGGTTWTAASLPTGVGLLRGVTCAGTTCLAAGTSSTATTGFVPGSGQLLTSPDGGTTWQLALGSTTHDDAFAVSCPDAKTCVVVGVNWVGQSQPIPTGSIVATLDGGGLWRSASLRYVPVGLDSVACPVVNRCFAVGGNVLVSISLPVALPAPKHGPPGTRAGSRTR